MTSPFERLQKLAEEKRKAKEAEKPRLEIVAPIKSEPPPIESPLSINIPAESEPAPIKRPLRSGARTFSAEHPPLSEPAPNQTGLMVEVVESGFTGLSNYILDKVFRTLKVNDQVVLLRLLRLSHGFGKSTCKVSMTTLGSACNLANTQLRASLKSLEALGHIERGITDYTNPNQMERGSFFTILLPMPAKKPASNRSPLRISAPSESEPNKYKELNKDLNRAKHLDVGKPTSEFNLEREVETLHEIEDWQKWEDNYTSDQWALIVKEMED